MHDDNSPGDIWSNNEYRGLEAGNVVVVGRGLIASVGLGAFPIPPTQYPPEVATWGQCVEEWYSPPFPQAAIVDCDGAVGRAALPCR